MDDSTSGTPKKRPREEWDSDASPDAAAPAAADAEAPANAVGGSPTAAAAVAPAAAAEANSEAFTSDSTDGMEGGERGGESSAGTGGSGDCSSGNGSGSPAVPSSGGQEPQAGEMQEAGADDGGAAPLKLDPPAAERPSAAVVDHSTSRMSAPAGLGLGSGIGLPPRVGGVLGPRRTSGGLPAVSIGGFNAIGGGAGGGGGIDASVPPAPGAWAPYDDRKEPSGQEAVEEDAVADAGRAAHGSPGSAACGGGGKSGSRKRPVVASPFAKPGAAPSGTHHPGRAQQLARARVEAVVDRGGGDNTRGDSTRIANGGGGGAGRILASTRIESGASMSSEPARGGGCDRQAAAWQPSATQDLQAQLGEEAAANGITGDQLQAALELAARVPLRSISVAESDGDAVVPGGGSGRDANGSRDAAAGRDKTLGAQEALDTLLAALLQVAAPRGPLGGEAAGAQRGALLRRLQAAALAAASDALAQWEAVQAHARAAKRGWRAASSLDGLAAQRRRLLKHMLRLPSEEAGEELLEALEAVRANVAAALRAAAGRDAAAAAARAAAGRLLSAGVGGVTGPQLAPGGSTEAAADRDLNRLYTLLRLLQALQANPEASSGSGLGPLSQVQLPATRSARVASRHLAKALLELPQALQAAICPTGDTAAAAPPPDVLDTKTPSARSPSASPPPLEQRLLPAAGLPSQLLQPAPMSVDPVTSPQQQAAGMQQANIARHPPPGSWTPFGGDTAANGDTRHLLFSGGLTPGQLQELQEQADAALPALQAWAPLQRFRWRAVIWSAASFAVHQGNLRSSLEGI